MALRLRKDCLDQTVDETWSFEPRYTQVEVRGIDPDFDSTRRLIEFTLKTAVRIPDLLKSR